MRIMDIPPSPAVRNDPDYPLLDALLEHRQQMVTLFVHTWNLTGNDVLDRIGGTAIALIDRYIAEYCAALGLPMPPLASIPKRTLEN